MLWKAPGHGFVTRSGSSRASTIFCEVRFPLASYEEGPLDIWVFPARAKFGLRRLLALSRSFKLELRHLCPQRTAQTELPKQIVTVVFDPVLRELLALKPMIMITVHLALRPVAGIPSHCLRCVACQVPRHTSLSPAKKRSFKAIWHQGRRRSFPSQLSRLPSPEGSVTQPVRDEIFRYIFIK